MGFILKFLGGKFGMYALAGVAVAMLGLTTWGFYERSGKLSAQKDVVELQGAVELRDSRIREQNRGIFALGNATTAANARADLLAKMRDRTNAPLVRQLASLEEALSKPAVAGEPAKSCKDALAEWRAGK